jgi:hypothetical protein
MQPHSHAIPGGADPARPAAASILQDEALQHLGTTADDCDDAATRLRWLANTACLEHDLPPDQWLAPEQVARLQRLATLADLLAAEARAVLAEVVAA